MAPKTQENSKSSQIQQSQHKSEPNFSKKKALISGDSITRRRNLFCDLAKTEQKSWKIRKAGLYAI
jgi:hypothetical protein